MPPGINPKGGVGCVAYVASYMYTNDGPRWYHFTGPMGSVSEKASYETAARRAAAERLDCEEHELICTGSDPVKITYKLNR